MAAPGTDIVLSDDRLASARNFANKIWNASRFLFVNLDKFEQGGTSLDELAAPQIRTKAPYASGEDWHELTAGYSQGSPRLSAR